MTAMTPVRTIGLPQPGHSVHGQPNLAQAWQFNRCDDDEEISMIDGRGMHIRQEVFL